MSVVSRPGRPLAMVCDRCGAECERPAALDEGDIVRVDAQMHGWTYDVDRAERDHCPRCDGYWDAEDELAEACRDAAGPDGEEL